MPATRSSYMHSIILCFPEWKLVYLPLGLSNNIIIIRSAAIGMLTLPKMMMQLKKQLWSNMAKHHEDE